jgi:hypothetical protein
MIIEPPGRMELGPILFRDSSAVNNSRDECIILSSRNLFVAVQDAVGMHVYKVSSI